MTAGCLHSFKTYLQEGVKIRHCWRRRLLAYNDQGSDKITSNADDGEMECEIGKMEIGRKITCTVAFGRLSLSPIQSHLMSNLTPQSSFISPSFYQDHSHLLYGLANPEELLVLFVEQLSEIC